MSVWSVGKSREMLRQWFDIDPKGIPADWDTKHWQQWIVTEFTADVHQEEVFLWFLDNYVADPTRREEALVALVKHRMGLDAET